MQNRSPLRVLISASADGEQEWNRHRRVLRIILALREWGFTVAQCQGLRRQEDKVHRAQVKANYQRHRHTVVERAKVRMERIVRKTVASDPYFGYREDARKQVLQAREALAQGKIGVGTYNRLAREARTYCRVMIAHEKKVKALQDKLPSRPRLHLRRTKT